MWENLVRRENNPEVSCITFISASVSQKCKVSHFISGTVTIPNNILCHKPWLTHFTIHGTELDIGGPLNCCDNLTEFEITEHSLNNISILDGCLYLQHLDLSNGQIIVFPDLSNKNNLMEVDISYNKLTNLSAQLLPTSGNLSILHLENNLFTALPDLTTLIGHLPAEVSSAQIGDKCSLVKSTKWNKIKSIYCVLLNKMCFAGSLWWKPTFIWMWWMHLLEQDEWFYKCNFWWHTMHQLCRQGMGQHFCSTLGMSKGSHNPDV